MIYLNTIKSFSSIFVLGNKLILFVFEINLSIISFWYNADKFDRADLPRALTS